LDALATEAGSDDTGILRITILVDSEHACLIEEPARKKRFPWWARLLVILFPIPFGVVHWWITLTLTAIFAVVMWAINDYYNN
jgi:hypothetical protein